MEIIETGFEGLKIIKPKIFGDHRGYFFEPYNAQRFADFGIDVTFCQDNESLSHQHILRGLHFQRPPKAQGKLVRVVKGAVLDVVVDIRKNSATYGKHFRIELNEKNHLIFWIPEGFAHGFLTLEDNTIFQYKCTDFYAPETESGLLWNDSSLGIEWGIENPILSAKDLELQEFKTFKTPFI